MFNTIPECRFMLLYHTTLIRYPALPAHSSAGAFSTFVYNCASPHPAPIRRAWLQVTPRTTGGRLSCRFRLCPARRAVPTIGPTSLPTCAPPAHSHAAGHCPPFTRHGQATLPGHQVAPRAGDRAGQPPDLIVRALTAPNTLWAVCTRSG